MKALLAIIMLALASGALIQRRAAAAESAAARGIGEASWYGEGYRGKTMANGQPFDPDALTCAAWRWALGTRLKVTEPRSGRAVIVEVTDRGPAAWTGCILDLSSAAFRRLAHPDLGKIRVIIEPVEP